MGRVWEIATGVTTVAALASWAIYVGGLGKLSQVLTGGQHTEYWKMEVIMLEWYTAIAQLFIIMFALVAALAGGLSRTHSMMQGFVVCNNFLLIVRATSRITHINAIADGTVTFNDLFSVNVSDDNAVNYLRAEAAGQVLSALINCVLVILMGLGGTVPFDYHAAQELAAQKAERKAREARRRAPQEMSRLGKSAPAQPA